MRAPAAKKYSEVRNKLRNLVLSKQAMCLKHKQFEQFAPAFDDLLATMPEYEIPAKYSLSTMFLTLVTGSVLFRFCCFAPCNESL